MDIERFREYCLSMAGVTESFPFDEDTLVFKIGGKMFALANVDIFESVTLKCDPAYAIELREKFEGSIVPGYHMNKEHWNTVSMAGDVPDDKILHLINHSYDLVVSKLPSKIRKELRQQE